MLTIVGTIKIDSEKRREHFVNNLRSMEPIAHLLEWRLNIAGRLAVSARKLIADRWPGAEITTDGEAMAYPIMRAQLDALPDDALCFYWLEDHWFVCEDPPAFEDVLDEFATSQAEVLTVSHLTCSWVQKAWLPVCSYTRARTEYRVNRETQARVWRYYPGAYAAGIPMVCKWGFSDDMLEQCRGGLESRKSPGAFELPPHKAKSFLEYRSWREFVPSFHVFREVFELTNNPRAILWTDALEIIEAREDKR